MYCLLTFLLFLALTLFSCRVNAQESNGPGPEQEEGPDAGFSSDSTSEAALQKQSDLLQAANDAALILFSDEEELDDLAWRALKRVGTVTNADRVGVWRNHGSMNEGLLCTRVFSWSVDHAANYLSITSGTASYDRNLPGWQQILSTGQSINTHLRETGPEEREHMGLNEIGSALAVPIIYHSLFWGFARIGCPAPSNTWGKGEENLLRFVGLLLASTMQRRQMQDALRESEERFRDVAAAAGEIVWELNAQGYCDFVSERFLALTGHDPAAFLGKRWEDFTFSTQDPDVTGSMFLASVPTGSFRGFEHRIATKNGSELWLLSSGKLLTGPEGIAGLRGTSLDITLAKKNAGELKTTLQALETANKELEISADQALEFARKAETANQAKSDFLANISHEIRTPLNAIIGMAYLLRKTSLSPQQSDYADKIHSGGVTLLGVVNDILDFSKIESGNMKMENQPFNLETLFDNLAAMIGAKAEEQGLDAAFHIEHDVPVFLVGDALRLGQVLTNLVGNAVKFTEKGGLSLRCMLDHLHAGKAQLRFVVNDTGIGIPEDRLNGLFDSFTQADTSITRKYGGTGLGLAIARNMLEMAGGTLALESSPEKGTTVTATITLDLDRESITNNLSENACPDSSGGALLNGLQVVLVDENELQRSMLVDMLQDMGCSVSAFKDMAQGFAAIAGTDGITSRPRILLLPFSLASAEEGRNMHHLTQVMHLANLPRILCIVPFGFNRDSPEAILKNSITGFISRPIVSSVLRRVLISATGSGNVHQDAAIGNDSHKAVDETGPLTPYFPECNVLLVEDNPVNQQIALELLRETGVSVTVADNGQTALDFLESDPAKFDLVFLDLQMPVMDGVTVIRRLRANPLFTTLPVVAMTAHATVDEREQCLAEGMNEHISKPIDVAALYETMRRWLKPLEMSLPEAAEDAPGGSAVDAGLLHDLGKLNSLLADDDAAACRLFADLEPKLAAVDKNASSTAAKAIAMFDFPAALAVLTPMANGLKSTRDRPED